MSSAKLGCFPADQLVGIYSGILQEVASAREIPSCPTEQAAFTRDRSHQQSARLEDSTDIVCIFHQRGEVLEAIKRNDDVEGIVTKRQQAGHRAIDLHQLVRDAARGENLSAFLQHQVLVVSGDI